MSCRTAKDFIEAQRTAMEVQRTLIYLLGHSYDLFQYKCMFRCKKYIILRKKYFWVIEIMLSVSCRTAKDL
jgi:hypothetical protein